METGLKITGINNLFTKNFIESKAYFMYCFNKVPCIQYVDKLDTGKVFSYIREVYGTAILGIFQYSRYNWAKRISLYDTTIIALRENCLIELYGNYCEVLYANEDYITATQLVSELVRFKVKEKKKDVEINLVARENYGLELKPMEIKKTRLDLSLYYEDDFRDVDLIIKERLSRRKDKGIVLLHGLPGTGKTTYLRYLIGSLKKKVLLLSPAMAGNMMNAEFMDLLIEHPDSIVIIEDAENVLVDRRISGDSSVSNLLNISDGLVADFLNVQLICTFNQPLSMIDSALMRKGRLIAKYEFGKLSVDKAQRLSNYLGFDTRIKNPMTIAEISCQHDKTEQVVRTEVIGFRRGILQN
ncbi:MAG: AAA family ATPase [Chitinophagaceae bacterium]|nr:AAA family ATPase [Chitinophagaceae bacterium]